eukprot:284815452_3
MFWLSSLTCGQPNAFSRYSHIFSSFCANMRRVVRSMLKRSCRETIKTNNSQTLVHDIRLASRQNIFENSPLAFYYFRDSIRLSFQGRRTKRRCRTAHLRVIRYFGHIILAFVGWAIFPGLVGGAK